MDFEILGAISDVETFATGSGIRELARLRRVYGPGAGASVRELLASAWLMVQSGWLNYIGMKPARLGVRN